MMRGAVQHIFLVSLMGQLLSSLSSVTAFLAAPRSKLHPRLPPSSHPTQYTQKTTTSAAATTRFIRPNTALQVAFLQDHHELIAAVVRDSNSILEQYGELLREYPLTTKSTTSATLAFLGDLIAQVASRSKAEDKENWYDVGRGLTFLGFGAAYTGAFQHVWFNYMGEHIVDWGSAVGLWGPQRVAQEVPLDSIVDTQAWWSYFDIVSTLEKPPTPAMLAAAKVSLNQFLMIPFLYMPLFFFVTSQFNLQKAKERAQDLYLPLMKRNYVYWLPTQFAQFFLLPTEWQIPFLSAASLVWTVILSSIGSQQQQQQQEDSLELSPVAVMSEAAMVIEEDVTLEDVREALVSEPVDKFLRDDRVGASATGLALGLLASAADEGILAETVSTVVNAEIGAGVALVSALGATAGLALAAAAGNNDENEEDAEKLEDSVVTSKGMDDPNYNLTSSSEEQAPFALEQS